MVAHSLAQAARDMGGQLVSGSAEALWRGAAIDSRRVHGDEIFFALAGERVDGHGFVGKALEAGASAAVVSQEVKADGALIRVEDTYTALHALTRARRREVPRNLVGITGSVGKTTTKELLAAMLGRRFRTARNPGNFNNLFGFPMALLNIPDDTEWMVAEMGMSVPGELGQISRLGQPDVVILTNVRPVHLENFPNLRGIAEAKAEILSGLPEDGLVVANADDPEILGILERHLASRPRVRVVTFGRGEDADLRGTEPEARSGGALGSRSAVTYDGETRDLELAVHGLYNAENGWAAAACALELGVPWADITTVAAGFEAATMRGQVHHLPGEIYLIDDSYNSNPVAAERALESALGLPARRRLALLGDMLELGPRAAEFHRDLGEKAARLGFASVAGVGDLSRQLAEAARHAGTDAHWFAAANEAARWATQFLEPGDLMLVKGSRGVGLETVVKAILDAHGGEAA